MMRSASCVRILLCAVISLSLSAVCYSQKPDNTGGGRNAATHQTIDLGGFPIPFGNSSFIQSYAFALNEPDVAGDVQVVGESHVPPSADGMPAGITPIRWTVQPDGTVVLTDLGLLPGETHGRATDINELGEMTITTYQSNNLQDGHPVLPAWFLPAVGSPRVELARNALQAEAIALNNLGMIPGYDHSPFPVGVVWYAATPEMQVSLGTFHPTDIDDGGVMSGFENFSPGSTSGTPSIASFVSGSLQVEPLIFATTGAATAISPNGQYVVGWALTGGIEQAFLWTRATGFLPLGTLGGQSSAALGVNDAGQVVGWSETGDRKNPQAAFLWQAGTMIDLNEVATGLRRSQLLTAKKINLAGYICGDMEVLAAGNRQEHAFALMPLSME